MKQKFLMAAAALMLAACSSKDDVRDGMADALVGKPIVLKGTLGDKAGALTRGLQESASTTGGATLTADWTTGDDMLAIYYKKEDNTYATALADISSADGTFTANLYAPAGGTVKLVYPAKRHDGQGGYSTKGIESQDGQLATIATDWDIATGSATMTVGDSEATLDGLAMAPQLAIAKFTLTDIYSGAPIDATRMTVSSADETAYTIVPDKAASTLYVAMTPGSIASPGFIALAGSHWFKNDYEATIAVEPGKFYIQPLNLTNQNQPAVETVDLSRVDCAGNPNPDDAMTTANCYMIHKAGRYKLPLVYGNAIKNGETNKDAYAYFKNPEWYRLLTFVNHKGQGISDPWLKNNGVTVSSAEVVWQDVEGLVTLSTDPAYVISDDYLELTVSKDADVQEGNAVVAVKDADGNIAWSWHIWVTKQTYGDLVTITVPRTWSGSDHLVGGVYKVAPTNLGWVGDAVGQGTNTYYQWGRKDPFPGKGDNVAYENRDDVTIADVIKHPNTFYNNTRQTVLDASDDHKVYCNLWNGSQYNFYWVNVPAATVKTVYDPCPPGFCVPTRIFFRNIKPTENFLWDNDNKGRWMSDGNARVFFPTTKQRYRESGHYAEFNSESYYWSASAADMTDITILKFEKGDDYTYTRSDYRSNGYAVRPVAEGTEELR